MLDVAAKAPSLSSCKPIDKGGNSAIYAGRRQQARLRRLRRGAHPGAARSGSPKDLQTGDGGDRGPALLRTRRHRSEESILRAAVEGPRSREAVEGGSTITQQLVRNLCISDPERRPRTQDHRGEAGEEYAKRHSKQEILGQYLNTASYGTINGSTAVGVQAASRIYFSRPVWKLSLRRAALLAGLPQAPTDYNPILNPVGARERRDEVLAKMASLGFISGAEAAPRRTRGSGSTSRESFFSHRQPYFFDYVEDKLIEEYGVNTVRKGGLKVYTTIDPRLQTRPT